MIIRPFRYLIEPITSCMLLPWSMLRQMSVIPNGWNILHEDLKTDESS